MSGFAGPLPLPGWLHSSVAWLRCSWKCPRMALCWFSPVLEPSAAVKRSAIEFVHSGRTLNRKEGSSHSFWSYCLTTRLKQSNSSVAWAAALAILPVLVGREGGGMGEDGNWLLMAFTLFLIHSNCIFSWLTASGSRFQCFPLLEWKGLGRRREGAQLWLAPIHSFF